MSQSFPLVLAAFFALFVHLSKSINFQSIVMSALGSPVNRPDLFYSDCMLPKIVIEMGNFTPVTGQKARKPYFFCFVFRCDGERISRYPIDITVSREDSATKAVISDSKALKLGDGKTSLSMVLDYSKDPWPISCMLTNGYGLNVTRECTGVIKKDVLTKFTCEPGGNYLDPPPTTTTQSTTTTTPPPTTPQPTKLRTRHIVLIVIGILILLMLPLIIIPIGVYIDHQEDVQFMKEHEKKKAAAKAAKQNA